MTTIEVPSFQQGWGYLAFPLPPLLSPVFILRIGDGLAERGLERQWTYADVIDAVDGYD